MEVISIVTGYSDKLDLEKLKIGTPGITSRVGAYIMEAAIVCLEQEGHFSDINMDIKGECDHRVRIIWIDTGNIEQRTRSWKDADEATEYGACGIAALIIEELTDYTVVERSRKGTGFDYWLGKKELDNTLLQDKARLEVSGIRKGNESLIDSRIKLKMKQTERSDNGLRAVIIVVEFSNPLAKVRIK